MSPLGQITPRGRETPVLLDAHSARQKAGFQVVLRHENQEEDKLSEAETDALAGFATVSIQGSRSYARKKTASDIIRQQTNSLMTILRDRVG